MKSENIQSLYETCRTILINTEPISVQLEQVNNPQLKEKLIEIFRTVQSDLMIMTDFLYELMNCESESDIEFLLDLNSDINEVIN